VEVDWFRVSEAVQISYLLICDAVQCVLVVTDILGLRFGLMDQGTDRLFKMTVTTSLHCETTQKMEDLI
jgi:hypothetical protein